jgi:hypothetical protein
MNLDSYLECIILSVDGFDRGSERDRPTEVAGVGEGAVRGGEPGVSVESRTRGEEYADLRQIAQAGWDRGRRFDAPRGELAEFRTARAGLPEVSAGEASRYVKRHRAGRPWLEAAERGSPEGLRVIVAADQGGGHGHIRREGWVTEEASMRRVAYLEDPAQLDPGKRRAGIDGLRPRGRHHVCADMSSRITDPDALPPPSPACRVGADLQPARQRRAQGVHRMAAGAGGGKHRRREGQPPRVAGSDHGRPAGGRSRAEGAPCPDVRGRHDRFRHQSQQAA